MNLIVENTQPGGASNLKAAAPPDGVAEVQFSADGSTRGRIIYDFSQESMSFRSNGVDDRLVIGADGNVGVGTKAPTQRLDVAGRVSASGVQMPGYGKLVVYHSVTTHAVTVPWTAAEVAANYGTTHVWAANGPRFRDISRCGGGANPQYMVDNSSDKAWPGQYVVTFTDCQHPPCIQGSWSGWELQLYRPDDTVAAGPAMSRVDFTLTQYSAGVWSLEHMGGYVGTTLFECH